MEDKRKNEELIEKLMEKRKQENDAFIKLLNAMKGNELNEKKTDKPSSTRNAKRKKA